MKSSLTLINASEKDTTPSLGRAEPPSSFYYPKAPLPQDPTEGASSPLHRDKELLENAPPPHLLSSSLEKEDVVIMGRISRSSLFLFFPPE